MSCIIWLQPYVFHNQNSFLQCNDLPFQLMPSNAVHISCTGCTCPSVRCQNRWSIALALWFCPIERGPWLECDLTTGLAHSSAFVNLSQFAKHLDIEGGVGLSWTVELSSELRSAICPPAFHFPRFVELHCIGRSSDQPFPLFFIFCTSPSVN